METFAASIDKRKDTQKSEQKQEEDKLEAELKQKKEDALSNKVSKEQRQIILQELDLIKRQRMTRLTERFESEGKKLEEISGALLRLIKGLHIGSVLSEDEYYKILEYDIPQFVTIKTGAEALLEVLHTVNLEDLIVELRKETEKSSGAKYLKLVKRLRLLESMRKANIDPAAMIMAVLPVIPPDLRPMVQLVGGRFATSDLNDLYRRVINRNNRLKHLFPLERQKLFCETKKECYKKQLTR
jgi:DNA-directed RNA polymerase subunit beta'